MRKRLSSLLLAVVLILSCVIPVYASADASVPKAYTPDYKVSYYAFDCFNMMDESGRLYGYGYEMMQDISKYMQSTFSYIGFDKSAKECEEMLRNGELDIYTAARLTPEREAEFAFSKHPAITAKTCMNVKVGNNKVVSGDYSTYDGLRIGLLTRHTYNDRFKAFVEQKGFSCEIVYYDTPTELTNALIANDVDALVNSYISTPEDEQIVEDFGETPYYFMARKEDQSVIDNIDRAIDAMNIKTPNWRSDLYNTYYGSQSSNTKLTADEEALLEQMRSEKTVIRAVMNPDNNPYSWYENGKACGIAADILVSTADRLGLAYEILPVSDKKEYEEVLVSGDVDIWMDAKSYYGDSGDYKYKITSPYITTTVSIVRKRGSTAKINRIAVIGDDIDMNETIRYVWPNATIVRVDSTHDCVEEIVSGRVDGALLLSYTAQKLARNDAQNRLSVDIVPGAVTNLHMGINSRDNYNFYGLWEKTLEDTSSQYSYEIVQNYLESEKEPTFIAYLFDNPVYLFISVVVVCLLIFAILWNIQSITAKNRQRRISEQLSVALADARKANDAKVNFFSKMSHDIRTPLNVVLGMTQIARKYKYDHMKLDNALDNITTEGTYLLTLINSILDVNQLEYGHIELNNKAFSISECMRESVELLTPLAQKKSQKITTECEIDDENSVVVGDPGRYSQIIVNIVSNAIKYTEPGGKIKVSLVVMQDNNYRFICEDNGIGMTKEFIEHICDEYARAEDSRTSVVEGTGLGMSVVKGFTDLMHGRLTVESELGKGSVFTVDIPFETASLKQRERILHPVSENMDIDSNYVGKKVLLVEDNALNAEIAMELVQSMGFTVDWAENGKIGVDKYMQSDINEYMAIFMDMQMPVMDGIEATKCIRRCDRADNHIHIFAMTANTFESDRRECIKAGMDGYISKPVSLKEIREVIKDKCI